MALIAKQVPDPQKKDYLILKDASARLKLKPFTLKRWLKSGVIKNVTWAYDRRGWIIVHKNSLKAIRQYRDRVTIVKVH